MDILQVVSQANYHRQTAIDKLVAGGMSYREAGYAVEEVFEQLSMYTDDNN